MKNSLFLFILLLLGCLPPLSAQHECVLFSAPGGCYDSTFTLTLSCIDPSHHIRYTINGNTPTVESPLYEAPMMLDERLYSHADIYKTTISPPDLVYVPDSVRHAIVIRAAVFSENDQRLSETFTNTYLIHSLGFDERNLPVVSICADSLDLFDSINGIFVPGVLWNPNDSDHTGNYYQHGIEWERQINVEYYEPSSSEGINQICGLRTHGNLSRRHPAKGMKIYARDIYGKKRFQHTFFPNSHMNSFKRLVLKPFAVFYPYAGTQDYFCNTLAFQVGVDAPLCRPVILFLNGEYWGVYFIQEKIDEHFLEDHHGIDVEKCNIIDSWGGNAEQGNNLNFYHMMVWFQNTDLSDDAAYNYACSIIDMNNFIDYYILQTFIGNWDWPGNNMRCWQEGNGPWRWIFFDGDATLMGYSFDVFENAAVYTPPTTWINFPEAKLLFGKLLENNQFKKRFKERARELCESLFRFENTYPILNNMVETLRPFINDQRHRFGYPPTDDLWNYGNGIIQWHLSSGVESYLEAMDDFIKEGIGEFPYSSGQFLCYPNPNNGTFQLRLNGMDSETEEMQVYDRMGALVYKTKLNNAILSEQDNPSEETTLTLTLPLPAGLYFIRIGQATQPLIIQ